MSRQFQVAGAYVLGTAQRGVQIAGAYWQDNTAGATLGLIARPTADVSDGAWTPSAGADLFAAIDEASASDADYISTAIESSCTLALGDTSGVRDGYVLRVRAWSSDGSGMVVTLKQGETTIASWTDNPLPATASTINHVLTAEQIAAITDHSALRVTLEAIA